MPPNVWISAVSNCFKALTEDAGRGHRETRKPAKYELRFRSSFIDPATAKIMLLHSLTLPVSDFEKATGWQIKPEGACKGDVCIPLRGQSGATLQVEQLAEDMNLPLVAETSEQCWSLGPDSVGGKTLATAVAADMTLPDLDGNLFSLSSLRGKKVLVYAWAPY